MADRPKRVMCDEGKHKPIHRGILGGYFCGYCGACDFDGDRNWRFVRFPADPPQSDEQGGAA